MKDYLAGLLVMTVFMVIVGGAYVLFGLLTGARGADLTLVLMGAALLVLFGVTGFTFEWFTPPSHFRALFRKAGPKR
ncbi:MAG: hypothetical protein HYZ09_01185 [Candidatus Kerfeldbacteria bacterium]|nr:hypothetical protein [Candidatus Kerfeldbacteria bacterium]